MAPAIWLLEVANSLRTAERRGRLNPATTGASLDALLEQPILVDEEAPDIDRLLILARRHDLSVYDATYLDLALRLGRPLATLDQRLAAAARGEGVPVLA